MSDESPSRALVVLHRKVPPRVTELQPNQFAQLADARLAFATLPAPVTQSVMLALLQPATAIIDAYKARQRYYEDAEQGSASSPDDEIPALIALGESIVGNAIRGDGAAQALITERLEGKAGMRKGELDEATASTRVAVRTAIEAAVRALSEQPGDDATVIDQAPAR